MTNRPKENRAESPQDEARRVASRPIELESWYRSKVWGGQRIRETFHRPVGGNQIGESWEVHGDLAVQGSSLTLNELLRHCGPKLLGRALPPANEFPLLTKWLDCREWLSVQVHPDDEMAQKLTGDNQARGKTEAWYIYQTQEDSEVILGLQTEELSKGSLELEPESILAQLRRMKTENRQIVYVPAGKVHAIGPGNFIYEVQQSSDLTYRFYDWGRSRPLQRPQAFQCITQVDTTEAVVTETSVSCPHFHLELVSEDLRVRQDGEFFRVLCCPEGELVVEGGFGQHRLAQGSSLILPADLGEIFVKRESPKSHFLLIGPTGARRG